VKTDWESSEVYITVRDERTLVDKFLLKQSPTNSPTSPTYHSVHVARTRIINLDK